MRSFVKDTASRLFMVVAALLCFSFASNSYAWECPPGSAWDIAANACIVLPAPSNQQQAQGQGQNQNAQANSSATGGNGTGIGLGGAGGSSHANATGGSASNAGNSQVASTSYSESYREVRQAVDGHSSGSNNTESCVLEQHAGIGSIIGGFSIGHGRRDHDCARQAIAAELWARGDTVAGNRVYCSISEVREALGRGDCEALLNERASATIEVSPQSFVVPGNISVMPVDAVTHAELSAVEQRITSHLVTK